MSVSLDGSLALSLSPSVFQLLQSIKSQDDILTLALKASLTGVYQWAYRAETVPLNALTDTS